MAHTHYTAFTVQTGKVPSAQTNFPVVLRFTDARFKTTGNGGHVANSNGYDLRPYSDSGLTTALTFELVTFSPTTGAFEMWVKVPSLADGYVIYLGYGDAALNTNGSSSTTWDSNFTGVYHLKDGTTLAVTDSSQSGNNGTNSGATATTGQIDGGAAFVAASSQSITLPNADKVGNLTAYTIAGWFKTSDTTPGAGKTFYGEGNSGSNTPNLEVAIGEDGTGKVRLFHRDDGGTNAYLFGSTNFADGNWHYFVMLRTASNAFELLIDDSSQGTDSTSIGTTTTDQPSIGVLARTTPTHYMDGSLDEIQRSKVARSANWNTTSFNNQGNPGTFFSTGTEQAVGGGGAAFIARSTVITQAVKRASFF